MSSLSIFLSPLFSRPLRFQTYILHGVHTPDVGQECGTGILYPGSCFLVQGLVQWRNEETERFLGKLDTSTRSAGVVDGEEWTEKD